MEEAARTNPLPFRLGLLGLSEDLLAAEYLSSEQRHARLFDYLQGHALHAYGYHHPHSDLPRREAKEVEAAARHNDVATHYVWADTPAVLDPELVHAEAAIHARLASTASHAGARTYTLHPPPRSQSSTEKFSQLLGAIQDRLRHAEPDPVALGILTPPTPNHLLHRVLELRDFARSNGVHVTPHAGFLYAADRQERDRDAWAKLLRECASPLVIYANQGFEASAWLGSISYEREATATPPIAPLLQALLDLGSKETSLLVRGGHNAETIEILELLCTLGGQDARAILDSRTFQFNERKRARLAPRTK